MLKVELDVEVIRSSMLAGEVDDAVAWIEKAIRNSEIYEKVTGKKKLVPRVSFLREVRRYLAGESSIAELREAIEKIPLIRSSVVEPDNFGEFLDNFLYIIQFAADRYNVKYPDFVGKRCDDK